MIVTTTITDTGINTMSKTELTHESIVKNLKPKQVIAAKELAKGTSSKRTAEICGVTSRTIGNWKTDMSFKDAVNKLTYLRLSELYL